MPRTHHNNAPFQRLNFLILIGSVELKPLGLPRLNNRILGEFDQHQSEMKTNNVLLMVYSMTIVVDSTHLFNARKLSIYV